MNFKAILYFLSFFCFPVSVLAFINILYSSYFDYFLSVDSYIVTLIISLIIGIGLNFFGKNSIKRLNFFEQIILIIFTYFLISLLISIPFYLSNYQVPLVNALFEAFSGMTGTGFSIFENVKYLDPTLILWRSSSQWIGGFYFLIFLILLFSNKQFNYKLNYLTYSSDGSINTENNIKDLTIKIFLFYSIITCFIFFLLSLSEVRLYNALNLSMTLVSSGGFLPTNTLHQIIITNSQKLFLILSFIISILNFFLIFNLFEKRRIKNDHNEDLAIIITALFFILISLLSIKELEIFDIVINVFSSIGNSGLTLHGAPDNVGLFFLLLTLIGGSIISNTSGIKLIRIYILLKSSSSEILKLVRPNSILNQNIFYSDKKITNENIKSSFLIFISFFISIFILSGVLLLDSINFEDSFKLSLLTLTNTAVSDIYGVSNINFSNLLTSSKISLIIFMIVGKIELISIFLIIKKFFFKS